MKNIKACLICPVNPNMFGLVSKYYHILPQLGIAYLASFLEKHGYRTFIIDTTVRRLSREETVELAMQFSPDIVGIYSLSCSFPEALAICRGIKKMDTSTKTIIGGPHSFAIKSDSTMPDAVDYFCQGEGELTLLKLLQCNFDSNVLHQVPGLVYTDKDKVLRINPIGLINDIDQIPFPARNKFADFRSFRPAINCYKKLPSTSIITSRGCPSQCVFCQSGKKASRVRYHSAEYVLEEIDFLYKELDIRDLIIFDDTFVVQKERCIKILEGLINNNYQLSWSCYVKVNFLNKEIIRLMKRAGCWLIMPGIESGNQQILNILKKGITLEQVRTVCEWAYRAGLQIRPSFMIGNPGETAKTLEDTIHFALSLPIQYMVASFCTPLPGTQLYDSVDKYGEFDKTLPEKIKFMTNEPVFIPYSLDAALLKNTLRGMYTKFYMRPIIIYRHLIQINSITDIYRLVNAILMAVTLGFKSLMRILFEYTHILKSKI